MNKRMGKVFRKVNKSGSRFWNPVHFQICSRVKELFLKNNLGFTNITREQDPWHQLTNQETHIEQDWPITLRRKPTTLPAMPSVGNYERRHIMCLKERRSVEAGGPAAAGFVSLDSFFSRPCIPFLKYFPSTK